MDKQHPNHVWLNPVTEPTDTREEKKNYGQHSAIVSDRRLDPEYDDRFYVESNSPPSFMRPTLERNSFKTTNDTSQYNAEGFIADDESEDSFETEGYNSASNSPRSPRNDQMFFSHPQPHFGQNGLYHTGVMNNNYTQVSQYNRMYNNTYPHFNAVGKVYPVLHGTNSMTPFSGYIQPNSNFIAGHPHELGERDFTESDDESGVSEGHLEDEVNQETNLPTPRQPKSSAIDINIPKAPIWNPLPLKSTNVLEQLERPRNKNFGKVAINMDTNLSSSTDDLLKLAGCGHMQRIGAQFTSYEESPPSDSLLHNYHGHQISTAPQRSIRIIDTDNVVLPKRNRKEVPREVVEDNDHAQNEESEININEEFPQIVQDFRNMSLLPVGPLAEVPQPIPIMPVGPVPEGVIPASRTQQPICRYFANGFCSRGERCNFLHLEHNFINATPIFHKTRFKNGRIPIPASRYANLKIEECVGEIYDMCLDQHGCRYLQRQLDTGDPQIITLIFTEVIPNIVELMSDPFGNYLCQKLIEHCSEKQRLEIVKGIAGDLVHISKNMHGTRAVQKLVEHLLSPEENDLVRKALKGSVVALIQDLNGNHVIQKCLHKMEPNDNQFIYDAVAQHCVQVSTHRHGCCVMQRCIDHGTQDQKLQLVEEIRKMALTLVQDAFGNYVVQYALDLDILTLPTELIKQLHGKLHYLAKQKFSSNVVEKCLKAGDSECVLRVLRELMGENPDPKVSPRPLSAPESDIIQQKLVELLQDSYGNYVIQTCLSEGAVKAPSDYIRMANLLRPYVHQLRTAPYIKRIHNLLNLPTNPDSVTCSDVISDGQISPLGSPLRQAHRHPRTNGRGTLYYQTNTPHYAPQQFPIPTPTPTPTTTPTPLNHYQPAPHNPSYHPKPRR